MPFVCVCFGKSRAVGGDEEREFVEHGDQSAVTKRWDRDALRPNFDKTPERGRPASLLAVRWDIVLRLFKDPIP